MAIRTIYDPRPQIDGGTLRVGGEEHQHLHVARVRVDEAIEVFDGKGNVWDAVVESCERRETVVRILGSRKVEPDRRELILGMSLIRAAAFEYALEKAVEAGVNRIIPMAAARSNVKSHGGERWQRIIVEAAKQSKRYHLPVLEEPCTFAQLLGFEAASRIVFAERRGAAMRPGVVASPVLYLIGPEGGWTDEELDSAVKHGFMLAALGSTILKAETAAVVATFLLRNPVEDEKPNFESFSG